MLTIITPKKYIPTIKKPLIFLAGPIRGAPAWQDEAIDIFLKKGYEGFLVNPSRTLAQRHEQHGALGCEQHFTRQRAWEHHYLTLARKEAPQGAIMFYLIGEQHHRCEKSYAAMTRLELGQHLTEYQKDPSSRICIGSPAEKEQ
ncbi:MAG: hypothetical protein Q7R96_04535, partial [Nanoarchaeota archaeon]|nr:hypothetical protein [Nanoarchaeota archaeon]